MLLSLTAVVKKSSLGLLWALFAIVAGQFLAVSSASAQIIRPKVVIVAYFETSKEYGEQGYWGEADKPGEMYNWIKAYDLNRRIPVVGAFNPVMANEDGSIIAIKVGPNALHPAVNLTALGLDPQFDLSKSYWLINGIAGASPYVATIGDVVWTDFVVNGDVAHEIDAREIPDDWPDGFFMPGHDRPDFQPRVNEGTSEDVRSWGETFQSNRSHTVTKLNQGLMRWALSLTEDTVLPDDATMQGVRAQYTQGPARHMPRVMSGATLSAETFWLGAGMDAWARRWVGYMTDGEGIFTSTATNDSGTMLSLIALGRAGKVDPNRVMLIRGISNFDMPPGSITAVENLQRDGPHNWAGYLPALEGIYAVGAKVVDEITSNWAMYDEQTPSVSP
jgi:purine nucleoside permease